MMSEPKVFYIWWKEIVIGPFPEAEMNNLDYDYLEKVIDKLLEEGVFPKTLPMNEDMMQNPNVPHILRKK